MNASQRTTLLIGAAVVAAIILFPPFTVFGEHGTVSVHRFGFLLSAPEGAPGGLRLTINVALLAVELLGAMACTAMVWLALKDQ